MTRDSTPGSGTLADVAPLHPLRYAPAPQRYNPSMSDDLIFGVCHICKEKTLIRFCSTCNHFFCEECRSQYWKRGIEFVKELTGRKTADCCGPIVKLS